MARLAQATAIWLQALVVCPAPLPPMRLMFFPMASKTGRQSSKTACSPPTMIDSVPCRAPTSPPLTGASSMCTPDSLRRAEISRVTRGEMVLMSMTVAPLRAPWTTPSSPRITASMSGVSVTMVMITSLPSAASLGEAARRPPASTTSRTPGRSERL